MGAYAREPENISKSCKSRGDNLRVHFKVSSRIFLKSRRMLTAFIYRTLARRRLPSNVWPSAALSASWRTSLSSRNAFPSVASTVASAALPKPNNGEPPLVAGPRSPPTSSCSCWRTLRPTPTTKAWTSTDWSSITFRWGNIVQNPVCGDFNTFLHDYFRSTALHACVVAHTVLTVVLIPTCHRHATSSWLWPRRKRSYRRNQPRTSQQRRSSPKRSFRSRRRRWCAMNKRAHQRPGMFLSFLRDPSVNIKHQIKRAKFLKHKIQNASFFV